jgi:hypothetical protein
MDNFIVTPPRNLEPYSPIPVIHELSEIYLVLHKAVRLFPKLEKYSLGIMIEKIVLEAIQKCLTGTALPKEYKIQALAEASALFDTLKIFTRIALNTNCLAEKHYLELVPMFGTVGKMLGGWIKEAKKFTANPNPKPKLF